MSAGERIIVELDGKVLARAIVEESERRESEMREFVTAKRRAGVGWGSIAADLNAKGHKAYELRKIMGPPGCHTIHGTLVARWAKRNGIQ